MKRKIEATRKPIVAQDILTILDVLLQLVNVVEAIIGLFERLFGTAE